VGLLSSSIFSVRAAAGVAAIVVAGCSVQSESYTADADADSTHALVEVERAASLDGAQSAQAIASFVRVPLAVDAESAMALVGLGFEPPPVDQCAAREREISSIPDAPVEFLEAGDVSIAAGGSLAVLAPRALPSVTDLISGVVYTSRDQDVEPFPTNVLYRVSASGGHSVAGLTLSGRAPASLEAVTLGGQMLTHGMRITPYQQLDLTWAVGDPADLLYAELTSPGGSTYGCTFRDDVGAGTIPSRAADGLGAARLTLHRIRRADLGSVGSLARAELRFDLVLSASVVLAE
jgi:hypothetical protein